MESKPDATQISLKYYNFPHSEEKDWRESKMPHLLKISEAKTIKDMLPSFK